MPARESREFTGREVRLFPSLHIRSDREAEQRATASLLAVLSAVSEYGRLIVRRAGGPAGRLSCYTEVPFDLRRKGSKPTRVRPDGLIHATRGKTRWTALVEAKVGGNDLDTDQVNGYHQLAGQEGFNAVITVSNQPARSDGSPPVDLDGRRLRSVPVTRLSWERLLSEAQVLSRRKAVSDPDQKWMLDEWIRYVDDPSSRIIVPPDLGPHWAGIVRAARTGSLKKNSPELREVAEQWLGYLVKASLRLRAKLGVDVRARRSRAERNEPRVGVDRVVTEASADSVLAGALIVPDAVGDLTIEVFLHSQTVRYGVTLRAPTEGRQLTRLRWLARQLRTLPDLPPGLRVTVHWAGRRLSSSVRAADFTESASALLVDAQGAPIPKDVMPRRFLLQLERPVARVRGRSSVRVLAGISSGLEDFYRAVVEDLVPYVRPAPRLPGREQQSQAEQTPASASEEATVPYSQLGDL